MRIVGLTGGIACGKSTVTAQLLLHNVPVVDCDLIARQIVLPGTPTLLSIQKTFGPKVLHKDGSLNRLALGQIIFNDPNQNRTLGKLMSGAIQKQIAWQVARAFLLGSQLVVIDAPTLYETKSLVKLCGEIVVVAVDEKIQLERLMARDNSTEKEALSRVTSQLSIQTKIEHPSTTEVVYNNGTIEELALKVDKVISRLQSRAGLLHRVLTLPGLVVMCAGVLGCRM